MPTDPDQPSPQTSDRRWEGWLIEVLASSSLRDLRLLMLALAQRLSQEEGPSQRGLLVLTKSRISQASLERELSELATVLRPELFRRVAVFNADGGIEDFLKKPDTPGDLRSPEFQAYVDRLLKPGSVDARPYGSAPGSGKDAVLEYLILSWLHKEGPLSMLELQRRIGVSYPTVAAVVRDLETSGSLERGFKRSVELRQFPWAQWQNWLARMSTSRKTVLFRSTVHRSDIALRMVERMGRLGRDDVAIGGTLGAAMHFPKLDVVGTPRLDLVVLGEPGDFTQEEVARLDPSLEAIFGQAHTADLAAHFVGRRRTPHFLKVGERLYADELNCIADLCELGLVGPANEMLRSLVGARSTAA